MTDVPTEPTRAEALAALAVAETVPTGPTVVLTGDTVEAGGDVERVLLMNANLAYVLPGGLFFYPVVTIGDRVLVSAAQAARLDRLGATIPEADLHPTADPDDDPAALNVTLEVLDDDALEALDAPGRVDYIGRARAAGNVDEVDRVRALEADRPESQRRKSVLDALGA